MKILFVDTETTGVRHSDRIVQIYYKTLDNTIKRNVYANPGISIPVEATNVHGITDDAVRHLKPFREQTEYADELALLFTQNVVVAHNAIFDLKMIEKEGIWIPNWYIDTLQISRILYPKSPNHKLSTLATYLNLYDSEELHTADGDVALLEKIFLKMFYDMKEQHKVDDREVIRKMCNQSKSYTGEQVMPFGKHKGVKISEVPVSYFEWLLKTKKQERAELISQGKQESELPRLSYILEEAIKDRLKLTELY